MRDLRGTDGRVAQPRRLAAERSAGAHAREARDGGGGVLHVRALRRRQHAQHPRPLPRARSSAGRVLRSRPEAPRGVTDYVLTIDLGTSGPKVALFTFDGAFVDGDFTPVDLRVLPDGGVEQSPDEWWAGATAASRRLMDRAAVAPEDVVAVSVTSQWSGTVAVGGDGVPLHDAIIWMDARGADETRRVVGGAIRLQGYDPRKLRKWISRTGG